MFSFYINYFNIFIILSILFFKYQALENNAKNEDIQSFNLIQNDLFSRHFINYDSINTFARENSEIKYVKKRQSDEKRKAAPRRHLPRRPSGKTTKAKKSAYREIIPIRLAAKKITPKPSTKPKPVKYAIFISYVIDEINRIRKYFQAPAIKVNSGLTKKAQELADKLLKTKKWKHYKDDKFGVITYFTPNIKKVFFPVDIWTDGWRKIDYKNLEKTVPPVFSQIIWVSSNIIGCAISEQKPKDGALTLCLFYRKGNIKGKYGINIRKPKKNSIIKIDK
uniref:SCP domain-containing protein n=1 Tax=Strongyloides papillosus TaxID=174720 RepID=A0A0N5BL46_STREA